jgi:hypothetical protein
MSHVGNAFLFTTTLKEFHKKVEQTQQKIQPFFLKNLNLHVYILNTNHQKIT